MNSQLKDDRTNVDISHKYCLDCLWRVLFRTCVSVHGYANHHFTGDNKTDTCHIALGNPMLTSFSTVLHPYLLYHIYAYEIDFHAFSVQEPMTWPNCFIPRNSSAQLISTREISRVFRRNSIRHTILTSVFIQHTKSRNVCTDLEKKQTTQKRQARTFLRTFL